MVPHSLTPNANILVARAGRAIVRSIAAVAARPSPSAVVTHDIGLKALTSLIFGAWHPPQGLAAITRVTASAVSSQSRISADRCSITRRSRAKSLAS